MKRVVVTGLGLISSLGIGLEESWKKLIDGETGIEFWSGSQEVIELDLKTLARSDPLPSGFPSCGSHSCLTR